MLRERARAALIPQAALVVIVAIGVFAASCSGGSDGADGPDSYIPESVAGTPVDTENALATSLADGLGDQGVDATASGVVVKDDKAVLILLALEGSEDKIDEMRDQLLGSFSILPSQDPSASEEVDGTELDVYEGTAQRDPVSVAAAVPAQSVLLVAVALEGGDAAAAAAMREMLNAQ